MKTNSKKPYASPQCECIGISLDEVVCAGSKLEKGGIDGLSEDNSSATYIWN